VYFMVRVMRLETSKEGLDEDVGKLVSRMSIHILSPLVSQFSLAPLIEHSRHIGCKLPFLARTIEHSDKDQ
jgi:hypothetical protein